MNNPYLTIEEIRDTFINTKLEENYNFLEEDLEKLASAFVMAAMPKIVRTERTMCIDFVRTLNGPVAQALEDKRGAL
jgi:hypothetical protein